MMQSIYKLWRGRPGYGERSVRRVVVGGVGCVAGDGRDVEVQKGSGRGWRHMPGAPLLEYNNNNNDFNDFNDDDDDDGNNGNNNKDNNNNNRGFSEASGGRYLMG